MRIYQVLIFLIIFVNIGLTKMVRYYYGDDVSFSYVSKHTTKYDIEQEEILLLSYNDILIYLFNLIDRNKDMLLDFREMTMYQYYTEPTIEISYGTFKQVCKLLDPQNILHYPVGLDLDMFNASYTLYKNELGTNIYKDFNQIMKLMNAI